MPNLVIAHADFGQDVLTRGTELFRVLDDRTFGRRSRRSGNDRWGRLGLLLWSRFGFGRLLGRGDGNLGQRGLSTRALKRGLRGERGESGTQNPADGRAHRGSPDAGEHEKTGGSGRRRKQRQRFAGGGARA